MSRVPYSGAVTSVTVLYLLGLYLGRLRGRIDDEAMRTMLSALERIPAQIQQILVVLPDIVEPQRHNAHIGNKSNVRISKTAGGAAAAR